MRAALSLTVALVIQLAVWVPPAQAQPPCRFVLGFVSLRESVGAQKVGQCLEDEHFNLENGNAEQRTAGGLLVWRKADNFTACTDGSTTWVNGPNGVQSRMNSERFAWERDPAQPTGPAVATSPSTMTPSAAAVAPATTTTTSPIPPQTPTPAPVPTARPPLLTDALRVRCVIVASNAMQGIPPSGSSNQMQASILDMCLAAASDAGEPGVACVDSS